jgi:hypothetical protein
MYFVQRVANLRATKAHAAADTLTASCLRLLRALALGGGTIVFMAFVATGYPIWGRLAHSLGVNVAIALAAAFVQVAAGAVALVCGGWSTVVDCGRNRYARVQGFGLLKVCVSNGGVLGLALCGGRAATTLMATGAAAIIVDGVRFALVRRAEPAAVSGEQISVRELLYGARGSALLNLASNTQSGLQPYVTASLSTIAVSVAIPARTLANGCRSVSNAIGGAVWVPIAARLAEHPEGRSRYDFWVRNAPVLAIVQLSALVGLLGVGPFLIPHWLPTKSAGVLSILPWCGAEQAVYAATMPSFFLLSALGRFGSLGLATLAFVLAAVVGIWLSVPMFGALGFAASNALAALVVLAPLLFTIERAYWRSIGIRVPYAVFARYGVGFAAAGLSLLSSRSPYVATGSMALLAAGTTAHWIHARWGRFSWTARVERIAHE